MSTKNKNKKKKRPPPSAAPTPPPEARGRRKSRAPKKGGDGGRVAPVVRGRHWNDNGMVVLTGLSIGSGGGSGGRGKNGKQQRRAFMDSCVVTCDLHDRAHRRRRLIFDGFNPHCDDSWTLMPWGEINIPGRDLPGQVRRYHPSQMVGTGSRRIGFDSMFDAAADTAARLEAAGIELGWHTTRPGEFSKGELDRANAFKGMSRDYVRNTLEQVTTQEAITRDEIGD